MPHQCTDCGRGFDDGSKEMLSGCPDCGGNTFQFLPASAANEQESEGQLEPADPPEPPEPEIDSTVARTVGSAATTVRDFVSRKTGPRDPPTESDIAGASSAVPATSGADGDGSSTVTADSFETGSDDIIVADESPVDSSVSTYPEPTAESSQQSRAPASGGHDNAEGPEDTAQASARSELVDPDGLESDSTRTGGVGKESQTTENPGTKRGLEGSSSNAENRVRPGGTARPSPGSGTRDSNTSSSDHDSGQPGESDDHTDSEDERPGLEDLREELNQQFESIRVLEPGHYELNLMGLYDREEYIIALQEDGKYTIQVPERWAD